jgi:beta-1,4-mannosyl-glycoprotein beta-1,4-N-acetylglucosaminyltransferase
MKGANKRRLSCLFYIKILFCFFASSAHGEFSASNEAISLQASKSKKKQKRIKIYDCFPFMNEFEVLKIRLNELNDQVDYFVLVESIETQRGTIKPLYFEENKHLFAQFLHKIIHVKIEETHPELVGWGRENFQRNCIARGLEGRCHSQDVILISDADEIPHKASILQAKRFLQEDGAEAVRFLQDMYRHKLNWINSVNNKDNLGGKWPWCGTVATTYKNFKKFGAQHFRTLKDNGPWPLIQQGGWHFNSMGGNEAIKLKHVSVIEGDDAAPTDEQIAEAFKVYYTVPIDASFPDYVRKNYAYLVSIGYIDDKFPPSDSWDAEAALLGE